MSDSADRYRNDLPPTGTKERHALRAREAHRRRAYGTLGPYDYVPVFAVRHVIKTLREAGFTYDRITEIYGVDSKQLCEYLRPETRRVKKHTHDHFTSIDVDLVLRTEKPSYRRGLKAPYRDLLRRYLAAGWSRAELAAIAGPPLRRDSDIWRDRGKYVSAEMMQAIDKMHAEIGERTKPDVDGAVKRRVTLLHGRGYQVPAAYDDTESGSWAS